MVTRRDVWVGMMLYPRHTLPTAIAPVLVAVGLAVHDRGFALLPALCALLVGWLVQLGGVFTDNYFNLTRHPDDAEHADFVEAVRTGVVTMAEMRRAIYACFEIAIVAGAFLLWRGGLPVLVVGVAAILAALAYSTGPYPLGDHGLGDPLFFVFFGLVSVGASYFVQTGALTAASVLAAVPIAALTTNILVIDNIRDREYDLAKGERTLAVIVGPFWSRVEYAALLALAYLVPIGFAFAPGFGPRALLPLLSLPYAIVVARRVFQSKTHAEMIPLTPQAGQVLIAHAALFAFGLAGR